MLVLENQVVVQYNFKWFILRDDTALDVLISYVKSDGYQYNLVMKMKDLKGRHSQIKSANTTQNQGSVFFRQY